MIELFPTPILIEDLSPPTNWHRKMCDFINLFYKRVSEHIDDNLSANDSPIIGLLTDNNSRNIHLSTEFEWLNSQIYKVCINYLQEIGVDTTQINIYAQKSWPVVSRKEADSFYLTPHKHTGSVLSIIYYLDVEESTSPIVFMDSNYLYDNLPLVESNQSKYTSRGMSFQPKSGRIIVFPSYLLHQVPNNTIKQRRVSISYDIMVTSKVNSNTNHIGNVILDPSTWKNLEARG